ncbi:MAG TPA: hypothetical protein VMJ70_00700 [Candidatus Sulfotelmatobacter sp.]|nr:hypothetical protein [Candidatus Sulfotelmatobacter sp.]
MRNRIVALAALAGIVMASPALAAHHLWKASEIFSNASGTVQYVELFCPAAGEAALGPFTVTASGHTFNFVTNLPSTATANTWVLIATPGYASAPGAVTPDYTLASGFLGTGGGTLNYASGIDIWNYGAMPTDGLHALARDGSTPVNTPTNFAGQTSTINVGTAVPMLPTWGLVLMVGALLIAASAMLRKREASLA